MRSHVAFLLAAITCAALAAPGLAQSDPNPAMNKPDKLAWELFIQVNSRAGGANSVFETYASDTDLFQPVPQYPTGPTIASLRAPILPRVARDSALDAGVLLPALPPGTPDQLEESRHNRTVFDFIVSNNLYKISGLKAAFGKNIQFPIDSIEVKANWIAIGDIPKWTNNQVTMLDASKFFHINSNRAGEKFALVAMHIITKQVPNWTWATFESRFNPGRCDILGCRDAFGAKDAVVAPMKNAGQQYPDCVKTAELSAILAKADIEPAYINYCLKGSQTDFVDATGLDIRLGNSVTESSFVATSSCMTCHGRAVFDATGQPTSVAGFLDPSSSPPIAPLGTLSPEWSWTFTSKPPIFEGKTGLKRIATSADFVWSVPFCAIDDSTNPPQPTSCNGK
jgi:hypothetical protein